MNIIEQESEKMRINSELMELARARTRLTSKIIDLDDIFEQDDLNQKLETYAGQFSKLRGLLLEHSLSASEKKLLKSQQEIIPVILPNQRKAVELAMSDDPQGKKQAEKLLYEVVLPGQTKMIGLLAELIQIEQEKISFLSTNSKYALKELQKRSVLIITFMFMIILLISAVVILRIKYIQDKLLNHQKNLEKTVNERTNDLLFSKNALEDSIKEIRNTQNKLIESEKMAALGSLVSGVAHEINTPLGVSITANSHLKTENEKVLDLIENNKLKKSNLNSFLEQVKQTVSIIEVNLDRSAKLIKNFKKVAVDQSIEEIRKFDLCEYTSEVLSSLKPEWKHTKVQVETDFPGRLEITTYPGAIAQIFTNLITNSLKHAFDDDFKNGLILIKLEKYSGKILITFSDNGKGMPSEVLTNIFNPFFTTKRGTGGTGLGMHIVYNLVTQKLNGRIECHSLVDQGSQFIIELPEVIQ
jgi:signal transduction histidine kinase